MRNAPHSRTPRHYHGGFKWKRKYPIPPRHRIPAYMHNSRGVFVTRNSRSREREYIEDGHALQSCRKSKGRVRVIPTYKKCTKPECASIKGKSEAQTEVSVAQRGKYWKANGWGCHSQDTSQEDSGVRSTAEDSTGGLVEISRRGKSINI